MGQFFDGWIASESQDHDAIKVKRLYVDINEGNWYDAALFSQIMYWHGRNKETGKRRLQIERNGFFWLAKRYEDWWRECRVSAETAKKSIARMVKRGLLVKNVWLFDGKPTVHVRVNIEGFELLANHCIAENKELAEDFELNRSNVPNGKGTIDQMETVQNTDSITETTTETTVEEIAPAVAVEPVLRIVEKNPVSAKPKKSKPDTIPASIMNPMKDAIAAAFGWEWQRMTKIEIGQIQAAAKQLCSAERTPEDVAIIYRYCKAQDWGSFTPLVLASKASEALKNVKRADVPTVAPDAPVILPNAGDFMPLDENGKYIEGVA